MIAALTALASLLTPAPPWGAVPIQPDQEPDWAAVAAAMGRPGATLPGGVRRFAFPRADLRVSVRGVALKPGFALGGWVAFAAHGTEAVAMGDLVLTPEELTPVLDLLQRGGVEPTAIHHHLAGESPRVLYMHIHAHGDAVRMAETIRAAIALTGAPAPAPAAFMPAPFPLDTEAIARIVGVAGRVNGGVLQFSVPRAEPIHEGDFIVPAAMGLGTAINFQPTEGGRAATTGDFVLLGGEVASVIRALRESGIEVTSLHNHLLQDEPRLFFLHFWGNHQAVRLARGLRAALDQTHSPSSPR